MPRSLPCERGRALRKGRMDSIKLQKGLHLAPLYDALCSAYKERGEWPDLSPAVISRLYQMMAMLSGISAMTTEDEGQPLVAVVASSPPALSRLSGELMEEDAEEGNREPRRPNKQLDTTMSTGKVNACKVKKSALYPLMFANMRIKLLHT